MDKKFNWTPFYSVNIQEIDEQHKEFLNIANSLIELSEKETIDQEEILTKAGQLGSYAFYHLSTEEEMFAKLKYPDSDEHIKYHSMFREKVNDFMSKIRDKDSDKKVIAIEMSMFAGDWLLNHILMADKKYSDFFNSHGIK